MILKFDDIVYRQDFTIQAKNEEYTVTVELTDKESEIVNAQIVDALNGNGSNDDELAEILFKEHLPKIKQLLIGNNYSSFIFAVIGNFSNFTLASILGAKNTTNQQD